MLTGCSSASEDATEAFEYVDVSAESYDPEMIEDTISSLLHPAYAEKIGENNSIVDISGSADPISKTLRFTMTAFTDDSRVAQADADAILAFFPERLDSVAFLYASGAGDDAAAATFQARERAADNVLRYGEEDAVAMAEEEAAEYGLPAVPDYSIYDDYRLVVYVTNEEGTLDLYGIREPGPDSIILWQ